MDLWYVIKERYILLSILMIILLASLILMFTTWKNRSSMPKSLVGMVIVLSVFIFGLSLAALIFAISFGYNS